MEDGGFSLLKSSNFFKKFDAEPRAEETSVILQCQGLLHFIALRCYSVCAFSI